MSEVTISSPGPTSSPARRLAEPVARAGGDRDVVDVAAEQRERAGAQVRRERLAALEMRPQPAFLGLCGQLPPRQLGGGAGNRPVRARVEVGDPFEDGELVTEGHPFDL